MPTIIGTASTRAHPCRYSDHPVEADLETTHRARTACPPQDPRGEGRAGSDRGDAVPAAGEVPVLAAVRPEPADQLLAQHLRGDDVVDHQLAGHSRRGG